MFTVTLIIEDLMDYLLNMSLHVVIGALLCTETTAVGDTAKMDERSLLTLPTVIFQTVTASKQSFFRLSLLMKGTQNNNRGGLKRMDNV